MSEQKAVRRPRHLMDPANPQRSAPSTDRSLGNVQKWVMSTLAVTTVLHMSWGLVVAAGTVGAGHRDAQIGLMVIAGLFGMMAVAAGMAIHQKMPLNPWLLLGVLPVLVSIPLVF